MYSAGLMARFPSSTISDPSLTFRSASCFMGISSSKPLRKIRSAAERSSATLGEGSKVWELVPSGTTPVTSASSPTTLDTMLVIGATVVTIRSFGPVGVTSGCRPQAANSSHSAAQVASFVNPW